VENKSFFLAACLSFSALFVALEAHAQDAAVEAALPEEEVEASIARGLAMQTEAARIKKEAETELATENDACDKKFLVNLCRRGARGRYLEKLNAGRQLDSEGRALERKGRMSEHEASRAKQASEAAARVEEDVKRTESVAKKREARERSAEERRAKRAAKEKKRAQRAAAQQEKAKEKQEKPANFSPL
jgi:colicin import membrane protein